LEERLTACLRRTQGKKGDNGEKNEKKSIQLYTARDTRGGKGTSLNGENKPTCTLRGEGRKIAAVSIKKKKRRRKISRVLTNTKTSEA